MVILWRSDDRCSSSKTHRLVSATTFVGRASRWRPPAARGPHIQATWLKKWRPRQESPPKHSDPSPDRCASRTGAGPSISRDGKAPDQSSALAFATASVLVGSEMKERSL